MLPAAHKHMLRLGLHLFFEFSELTLDDGAFQRFVILFGGAVPALLDFFQNLSFQL